MQQSRKNKQMKSLFTILTIFLLNITIVYSQAKKEIWLIGTAHEENNYINPDSLTNIFNQIKPDLILIELEEQHFTKDFDFKLNDDEVPDFLASSNENNAIYNYHKANNIQVRPFDINGRNDFYRNENYFEKENEMFSEMLKLNDENKFSESCKVDFDILLSTLINYSELHFNTLKEANSDVTTKFLATKNKINFELMISIIKQTNELKEWQEFAELRKEYWDKRNFVMVENIIKYVSEFPDKKIIVLVGNDHKYALLEPLKQANIIVKDYWED